MSADVVRTPLFVRGGPAEAPGNGGPHDPSPWRRTTLRTRLGLVAAVGVVVLLVAGGVALDGLAAMRDADREVVRVAEARRRNEVAARALDAVRDVASRVSPATDAEVNAAIDQLDDAGVALAARSPAPNLDPVVEEVRAGDTTVAQMATSLRDVARSGGTPTPTQIASLSAAHREAAASHESLESALASVQSRAEREVDGARRSALVRLAVVLGLGAAAMVAAALALARGITRSTRVLGQVMRRFGDGDLHSRAPEALDEVGVLARSFNLLADGTAERIRAMASDSERITQLRIVSEALEIAPDEADVHRIMEHALGMFVPGMPAELLVSSAGSTMLHQMVTNPNGGAPNCPVADLGDCVAIRWGRAVTWEHPDALNTCPLMRDRPSGPRSAACVPMASGGAVIGVLHATAEPGEPPSTSTVEQLVSLASRAGTRVAAIRTLERSRQQAGTDTLTGVANRRSLETAMVDLIRRSTPFVVVMADIDRFKLLNDNFGHEVGDRALRLFAEVLSDNVRGQDIVARIGGEEFVLVYPETDMERALEVIERIRSALAETLVDSGLPPFTCSFGVASSAMGEDVESILRVADAGLLTAKEEGRDRVVLADQELASKVFVPRAPSPPLHALHTGRETPPSGDEPPSSGPSSSPPDAAPSQPAASADTPAAGGRTSLFRPPGSGSSGPTPVGSEQPAGLWAPPVRPQDGTKDLGR